MNRYSDLEYLRLSRGQKFAYNFTSFFAGIPQALKNAGIGIGRFFQKDRREEMAEAEKEIKQNGQRRKAGAREPRDFRPAEMHARQEAEKHNLKRRAGEEIVAETERTRLPCDGKSSSGEKKNVLPRENEAEHPEPAHKNRKKDPVHPEKQAELEEHQAVPGPGLPHMPVREKKKKEENQKLREHFPGARIGEKQRKKAAEREKEERKQTENQRCRENHASLFSPHRSHRISCRASESAGRE